MATTINEVKFGYQRFIGTLLADPNSTEITHHRLAERLPAQLLQEHLAAAGNLAILWRFPDEPMSAAALHRAFKKARERVGIASRHSFHSLRHSTATHLLERGGNIEVIRDALGHRSADTTRGYARVTGTMFAALDHPVSGFPVLHR